MIELIFAIVIISFVVVTLPRMTQVTSQGIDNNLVQEAIFAASAELNQAVSYKWDENSTEKDGSSSFSKVINTGDCNPITKQRPGHVNRMCLNGLNTKATNTADANIDDLNDASHSPQNIFIGVMSKDGYKQNYKSEVMVDYASFGDTNASSKNIKEINVTITDSDGDTTTSLRTYSANIGEVDYYKRSY